MALPANEGRGEVAVTVDGVDLVLAAEMEKLAHLSSALGCKTLHELYQRLAGCELAAMYAVLNTCVVKGDADAAKAALTLSGAQTLGPAMLMVMAHHAGDTPSGNGRGARAKKKA